MVFREPRTGQFSNEEADVDFGGTEEAYGFHVADVGGLFAEGEGMSSGVIVGRKVGIAARIVETTDEVNFPR